MRGSEPTSRAFRLPITLLVAFTLAVSSLAASAQRVSAPAFDRARASADSILARPEFRTVEQPSAIEKELNLLAQWINDLLLGAAGLGRRQPWLVSLLEWSFFGLAAAAVLVWGFRTLRRQRLAVVFEAEATETVWRKESEDWAELARAQAEELAWRDAVHSLYWATIVMLEGRRFWRSNRARTPREYLHLLEPGSARQRALGGLTRIFERIWYGQRPASQSDYAGALALFEELSVV